MAVQTTYSVNIADDHTKGAGLYTIANEEVNINIFNYSLKFKYPKAYAKTKGIDIHQDFVWCNSANDKNEVPVIYAQEFELTWGQSVTNIQRIIDGYNQLKSQQPLDPYLVMYSAKETGFNYCFPNLLKSGGNLRDINNSWSGKSEFDFFKAASKSLGGISGLGKGLEKLTNTLDVAGEMASGVFTGFGFEDTQKFNGTPGRSFTISFPLYNTKDTKSAFKNYCFCLLFAFQNLKVRTSFMTYIPPKLYTITNPYGGGIYIPVAVVSNLKIDSIGTTRVLGDHMSDGLTNDNILIPEAYKVSITFQELISPSANIMLGAMGGSKITSMVMNDNALSTIGNVVNKAFGGILPEVVTTR